MKLDQSYIHLRQISDRANLHFFKCRHTGTPCHIQFPNRKRPHFHLYFLRKQCVDFIRFLKVRSHLRQQLIAGYPHIYRKSKPPVHLVLNLHCSFHRRDKLIHNPCKIHVTLIHTYLFNIRRIRFQKIHKRMTISGIHLMIRRYRYKIRTFTKGIRHRFSCANAIFFRRDRLGKHDPMAGLLVSANDRRYLSKVCLCAVFQLFHCAPAKIRRIDIDMKNDGHYA